MKYILLASLLAYSFCIKVYAQKSKEEYLRLQTPLQTYFAYKTAEEIVIDGKDQEAAWSKTAWSNSFEDIEGNIKIAPLYKTRVKMIWDNNNLYIYAELQEPDIKGFLHKKDTIIYHDNDFEIFVKPDVKDQEYYEIEINAINTVMDLLMNKPYRFGGKANLNWDLKLFKSAVYHSGTLNKSGDIDDYWAVEIKIPVTSIKRFGEPPYIQENEIWRINFSRVQWHYDVIDGNYKKKIDTQGKDRKEENWVWSPIGVINMHYPERWGRIKFVTKPNEEHIDEDFFLLEKTTWNLFYLQQFHKEDHGRFAKSVNELLQKYPFASIDTNRFRINILTKTNFYYLTVTDRSKTGNKASIDNRGSIHF